MRLSRSYTNLVKRKIIAILAQFTAIVVAALPLGECSDGTVHGKYNKPVGYSTSFFLGEQFVRANG